MNGDEFMFTVLIAEKRYIDAIQQENKLFFEPFLGKNNFAFCVWKPEGQTLNESVPDLFDIVARKKEWRAVIIHSANVEQLKKQNPYDLVDNSKISALPKPQDRPTGGEAWEKWLKSWQDYYDKLTPLREELFSNAFQFPLQRLSTWLCFRPADYVLEDVPEKMDVDEWAIDLLERNNLKPNVLLEKMEVNQYRTEMRIKEKLRRSFTKKQSINICYPMEICCISERITENGFFNPDSYWTIRSNSDYSSFVDRNMFFDKMRFMVFDVFPDTHSEYRTDSLRFLHAVMIFVTNKTPASAMQARKLYVFESDNDETPLYTLVTSFEKKLVDTADRIENEIERIRSEIPGRLTDKEVETIFCTPSDVPVILDESCDTEALYASKDYGLSGTCPTDENAVWNEDFKRAKKSLSYIIKQQRRSVQNSINKMNLLNEVDGKDVSRLTVFQADDIRNYTENAEDEIVSELPPNFSTISAHLKNMDKNSTEVRRILEQRMSKKTTIVLGAICLGLFLLCFLPLFFSNFGNAKTVSVAAFLIGSVLGVLVIMMLVSLFFLRSSLISAINTFNHKSSDIFNDIIFTMQKYSKYLSSLCNARRGHTVLRYVEKNFDEYTKNIRIRKKHQEDIRKKRAFLLEEYGDFIMDQSYCDETMCRPYDYDFDQKVEYPYPAPFLAGDFRQIEFLVSGNYITVPSSYVKRLLIRVEEIYDR